jgi:hypothetical protein
MLALILSIGHVLGHAGNHWSLFEHDCLNKLISTFFTNLWGLYEKNWEFSHIISHHCYNYTDKDYIIEQHVPSQFYPVRACDPWKPIHAYQHYFYQISHIIAFLIGGIRLDCAPWIFVSPFLRSLQRNTESWTPAPQFDPIVHIMNYITMKMVLVLNIFISFMKIMIISFQSC